MVQLCLNLQKMVGWLDDRGCFINWNVVFSCLLNPPFLFLCVLKVFFYYVGNSYPECLINTVLGSLRWSMADFRCGNYFLLNLIYICYILYFIYNDFEIYVSSHTEGFGLEKGLYVSLKSGSSPADDHHCQ
jgi:hypothetical protein